ncbi:ATP-grasp domain-containing protein [Zooshikella ganghwensis]|uniref:ATP-grasp domain-containing protein n=1 Tax=Zooshikella ganghwensis TaxID=202772 RepID=A0A4P9VMZ4_9GAMM|nr:hypothetical protein [Zooshikella ganghwensis]RDH43764.1 hypothetical protein B9G39_10090 [Zooshikella ganghwensis]
MDTKKIIFIIQSRIGNALDISFDLITTQSDSALVLIAQQEVIEEVNRRKWTGYFKAILPVSPSFSFAEVSTSIEQYLSELESFKNNLTFEIVTINESKVDLCGKLKVHFGLQSQDLSHFVYKDKMKSFAQAQKINTPNFTVIDKNEAKKNLSQYSEKIIKHIGLPCFIKPVNMFASKHCHKINSKDQLENRLKVLVDDSLTYQAESFIDGNLYLCDTIVTRGQVRFLQVCEYSSPCVKIYDNPSLGWITLPRSDALNQKIEQFAYQVNNAFLPDESGVTHLEIFEKSGELSFLEIAYRSNGIEPSNFYLKRANIPLREMHFLTQINPDIPINIEESNYVACFLINYPQKAGKLKKIAKLPIQSEFSIRWNCDIGESLPSNQGYDAYAGTIIIWNQSYKTLRDDFEKMKSFEPLIID